MNDLTLIKSICIGAIFVWSGFVRSGLGFGSGVLSIPLLMLVLHDPLYFIPVLVVHSLFFTSITVFGNHFKPQDSGKRINWKILIPLLPVIIIPKLIGVTGLVILPRQLLRILIFCIILVYALSYVLNRPLRSKNKFLDKVFLVFGGYIHGTSLMGSPLMVTVISKYIDKEQLRSTLFVLWFILGIIKILALIYFKTDFHLASHLWLFPCALAGHFMGLTFNNYLNSVKSQVFYRVLGSVLLFISLIGLFDYIDH